jgi:hypothetical protein
MAVLITSSSKDGDSLGLKSLTFVLEEVEAVPIKAVSLLQSSKEEEEEEEEEDEDETFVVFISGSKAPP